MSRTGLTYGAANVYEALYFMEADPKALIGKDNGVYVFDYTDKVKKAHEEFSKNPDAAKISLSTAEKNFAKLGVALTESGAAGPKKRGRKPGRKPGRPAGKKPGRPAGKKRGRPAAKKPGRPAGKKPGRPKKSAKIKLVPPEQRAKIDAEVKSLLDQKKSRDEIVATLKGQYGGQAVAGSLRRMKSKK